MFSNTVNIIKNHKKGKSNIKLKEIPHKGLRYARKTAIDLSSGEIIITLDADLQNDPEDFSSLIEKIEMGYDIVNGWRKNRKLFQIVVNKISWLDNINILIARYFQQMLIAADNYFAVAGNYAFYEHIVVRIFTY